MLAQLVQLRVNYNMLDSDQIFINFVIKQFDSIEGGMVSTRKSLSCAWGGLLTAKFHLIQIRKSDELIPHVFFFLVLLTYEMYHSKGIIGMSKVIQLCDRLMASGRDPVSHGASYVAVSDWLIHIGRLCVSVVPALEPIVHDLFVVRASLKSDEVSTQREVVLSMLIKLVRFPQVGGGLLVFTLLNDVLRLLKI